MCSESPKRIAFVKFAEIIEGGARFLVTAKGFRLQTPLPPNRRGRLLIKLTVSDGGRVSRRPLSAA